MSEVEGTTEAPTAADSGDDGKGAVAEITATIHDLGYKRYFGTRRPQRTRYRTIVKNLVTSAWRGWWKMKAWVIGSFITVVVIGAIMYVQKTEIFKQLEKASGQSLSFADALLPLSFSYLTKIAFVLSLTVACSVVANDLKAGAFEFYFSRPVRPIDYVLGKVGGVLLVIGTVLFAGPVLLGIYRLGLVEDIDQLRTVWVVIPKMMLVGAVATAAYAIVPLAFSAISNNRRHAIAVFAVFHILAASIMTGIGAGTDTPELRAFDISEAVYGFAYGVFDIKLLADNPAPFAASIIALVSYIGLGLGFVYWRVARAQRAGLGGG